MTTASAAPPVPTVALLTGTGRSRTEIDTELDGVDCGAHRDALRLPRSTGALGRVEPCGSREVDDGVS